MIALPEEIPSLNLQAGFGAGHQVVGLTSGCFDVFHYYHLLYLERCRAQCDLLIVGVDSDEMIRQLKSKNPIIPEHHRTAVVAGLRSVNIAFTLRSLGQFEKLVPFVSKIFKNKSEMYGNKIIGEDSRTVVIVPDITELTSTTDIVKSIRESHG